MAAGRELDPKSARVPGKRHHPTPVMPGLDPGIHGQGWPPCCALPQFALHSSGGAWRSLVAHLLWEQGVAGSNPAAPTS